MPPPAPHATTNWILQNCKDCVKFLVDRQVLSPEGYSAGTLRSYYATALRNHGPGWDVASYLATNFSLEHCWNRIHLNNVSPFIFSTMLLFPEATRKLFERFWSHAPRVPPAIPAGNNLSGLLNPFHELNPASWIDTATAENLFQCGINISDFRHTNDGTFWTHMIADENPHRHSVMNWMARHPTTRDLSGSWKDSRTPVRDISRFTVDLSVGLAPAPLTSILRGVWSPWALANHYGDLKAAKILAQLGADPRIVSSIPWPVPAQQPMATRYRGAYRYRQPCWAAVTGLTYGGLDCLEFWLKHVDINLDDPGVADILDTLEYVCDGMATFFGLVHSTPRPPHTSPGAWDRQRRAEVKETMDIASSMIRLILDASCQTAYQEQAPRNDGWVQSADTGLAPIRTLIDTAAYRDWYTYMKARRSRGHFYGITRVWDQLQYRGIRTRARPTGRRNHVGYRRHPY